MEKDLQFLIDSKIEQFTSVKKFNYVKYRKFWSKLEINKFFYLLVLQAFCPFKTISFVINRKVRICLSNNLQKFTVYWNNKLYKQYICDQSVVVEQKYKEFFLKLIKTFFIVSRDLCPYLINKNHVGPIVNKYLFKKLQTTCK